MLKVMSRRTLIEALEIRCLMSGSALVDPVLTVGGVVDPQTGVTIYPDAEPADNDSFSPVASPAATLALSALPALDSLPGAADKIYLDFVGAPAMTWGGFSVPATPAYDTDGDPTTFSAQELTNINQIWSQVAETYSAFKIDVTTVDPDPVNHTNYPHHQDARIFIGGSNSWVGSNVGGISYIAGFSAAYLPNSSFVFPSALSDNSNYIADAAAHEAGHQFGLYHQSTYSGTTLTSEYNYGNSLVGPIMGCAYYSTRALWFDGQSDQSSTTIQDDMATIAGSSNGFGYRTEPSNISISTASALTLSGGAVSASGVIEHTTDSDVYSFNTAAGAISLNVNVAQYGAMLHAQEVLENGSGQVIASADNANTLGQTISATVSAGTYYLFVESFGQYGDVGQYTVSGTVASGNTAPIIVDPATVAASPVTAASTNLNVLASTTTGSSSSLVYTWNVLGTPPQPVQFTVNGTNTSNSTTAQFAASGTYNLQVTVTDPSDGMQTTSSVAAVVNQTLTSIVVLPSTNLLDGQTNQFFATAYDQFGLALNIQPTFAWSVDQGSRGTVSSTGLYSAPTAGTASDIVRATSGPISGMSIVNISSNVIAGTSGNDAIHLVRSGNSLLIYVNSSLPTYTLPYASLGPLAIAGGSGLDTINIDFSGGSSPVPVGGLSVDGTSGTDSLIITGTTGNDSASVTSNTIVFNNSPISYNAVDSIIINGNGGSDSFTQIAQPGNAATLTFNSVTVGGPSSNDTLNVSSGAFAFSAPLANAGVQPLALAALSIGDTALVAVNSRGSTSDRWVLTLGSLTLAGPDAQLDLGTADMIVHNPTSFGIISKAIATAFGQTGNWSGAGITSSAAQIDPTHLTSLGLMQSTLVTSFDGQTIGVGDVLVKHTYIGDANLDGKVDASDYSLIDSGYLTGATTWAGGDFNYDGVVNGSDYTLIDNAFNTQGAAFSAESSTNAQHDRATAVVVVAFPAATPSVSLGTYILYQQTQMDGSQSSRIELYVNKDLLDRLNIKN